MRNEMGTRGTGAGPCGIVARNCNRGRGAASALDLDPSTCGPVCPTDGPQHFSLSTPAGPSTNHVTLPSPTRPRTAPIGRSSSPGPVTPRSAPRDRTTPPDDAGEVNGDRGRIRPRQHSRPIVTHIPNSQRCGVVNIPEAGLRVLGHIPPVVVQGLVGMGKHQTGGQRRWQTTPDNAGRRPASLGAVAPSLGRKGFRGGVHRIRSSSPWSRTSFAWNCGVDAPGFVRMWRGWQEKPPSTANGRAVGGVRFGPCLHRRP